MSVNDAKFVTIIPYYFRGNDFMMRIPADPVMKQLNCYDLLKYKCPAQNALQSIYLIFQIEQLVRWISYYI